MLDFIPVAKHLKARVSGCLSLLLLLMLLHVHFIGDPCLQHREHTAQDLQGTRSCGSMACLCFFHAVYAPTEVGFSVMAHDFLPAEDTTSDRPVRLLAFEIFHPPRV